MESGTCGTNLTWTLTDDGVLEISGSGGMENYSESHYVPWYSCKDDITKVIIGDGVTSIGGDAFYGCSSLEDITIPKSVTTISSSAFVDCHKLIIYGYTGSVADSHAVTKNIAFVSLDGFAPNYIAGGQCGANAYWELYQNGKMIITGSGDLYNKTITTSDYVRNVEIGVGITSVGDASFSGCLGLISITIPDSVTKIGSRAFYECRSLASIIIPYGVTRINSYTFAFCNSLKNISIPNSVTSIGGDAFYNCYSLTSITIPDSIETIYSRAFLNCLGIETVNINDLYAWFNIDFSTSDSNPMNCGADLYLNGEKVTNLTIPEEITSIGKYTFYGCTSLLNVTVPTATTIADYAFNECTTVTLLSAAGSSTETYARANKLPFVAVDEGWEAKLSYYGKCGDNLMWQLYQDGRLAISFMNSVTSDVIYDYSSSVDPTWNTYSTMIRTVDFPFGITRVGDYAFDALAGILTVNYNADGNSWNEIEIGECNEPLEKADVNFSSAILNVNFNDVLKTTAKVNGRVIPVIINITAGTTWQELKANLVYSDYTDVKLYDTDGNEIASEDALSTGFLLHHIRKDGSVIEEVLLSVSGDVTGDSVVNVRDVQSVISHIAGEGNEINKIAIDTNLDDILTLQELNAYIATFRE